jgi:hypothetical protein
MLLVCCLICTMHRSDYRSFNDISQYGVSRWHCTRATARIISAQRLEVLKGVSVTKVDTAVCSNPR